MMMMNPEGESDGVINLSTNQRSSSSTPNGNSTEPDEVLDQVMREVLFFFLLENEIELTLGGGGGWK